MSHCFVGFDGFIDEILVPVAKRTAQNYVPFSSIPSFSEKIAEAAGKSCNIELISQRIKIGGNGPILANALALLGHKIILAGTLGVPTIDPIFAPLIEKCEEIFSYESPGRTNALEFPDGKIILGKLQSLVDLTHEKVIETIGEDHFFQILENSSLFVSTNWTMLPMINALWRYLLQVIVPKLTSKKRFFFIDLSDPAKRSDEDLKEALHLLREFDPTFYVILGLNHVEAERVAKLLGAIPTAESIVEKANIHQVVIHSSKKASTATQHETATQSTFFTPCPTLTTGAGDNFNAGFCHGLLQNLSLENSLQMGNACAGFYVREGRSPNVEELAIFMQHCDNIVQ